MNNADLQYRPLLCGVSLLNARVGEPGTLGYFGRDRAGSTWLISAYHVLCNADLSAYLADEPICQPAAAFDSYTVATTRSTKADAVLDCAAALVHAGIACQNAQLGLGPVGTPALPRVGMRVVKSGAVTGITEGLIKQVDNDTVRIEADPDFDTAYVLSAAGDSGCLWVEQETRAPVALHRGHSSPQRADALNILAALTSLSLDSL